MANKAKNFVVSTADFAFYVNDVLACTGTTNLDTSIEISEQEQNVNAGKGNKLVYSFKYGREMTAALQSADWKLEYISMNIGSPIAVAASDVYSIAECVDIVNGVGTLANVPVGDVGVELQNGTIVTVAPVGATIDLTSNGVTAGTVQATYKFNTVAKTVLVDADSTPMVGRLVLDADKHNNELGKVGSVQIVIPSYQLDGNFSIQFTPDGVTSTDMNGKALAVAGDKCSDGSAVYAYIHEFDTTDSALSVSDIAATPAVINLAVGEKKELTVLGLKGAMYAPIKIANEDCTFSTDKAATATVTGGVITAAAVGTTNINVAYGEYKDVVKVVVA